MIARYQTCKPSSLDELPEVRRSVEWWRSKFRSLAKLDRSLEGKTWAVNKLRTTLICVITHLFVAVCFCDWKVSHRLRTLSPYFRSHWWLEWSISLEASEIRHGGRKRVWASCRRKLSWWRLHGAWCSSDARTSSTHRRLASSTSPTEFGILRKRKGKWDSCHHARSYEVAAYHAIS